MSKQSQTETTFQKTHTVQGEEINLNMKMGTIINNKVKSNN